MDSWYKRDIHDPWKVYEQLLAHVSHDLDLLINDLAIEARGYKFHWAVDYSELFRYLHPMMDLLGTPIERWSQYISRQMAVRFFIDSGQHDRLLLPSTMREYQRDVERIAERVSNLHNEEIENYRQWAIEFGGPLKKRIPAISRLLQSTLASNDSTIREASRNAVKAQLVQGEYNSGVELFKKMVGSGRLAFRSAVEQSEIELEPQYQQALSEKIRPLNRSRHERTISNRTDAENLAYLSVLNTTRNNPDDLYVMITGSRHSRHREMTCGISPTIGNYPTTGGEFPLLRSLDYWLLRTYFITLARKNKETREKILKETEIYRIAAGLVENCHTVTTAAGQDRTGISDELKGEVENVMRLLSDLFSWKSSSALLHKHFNDAIGTLKHGQETLDRTKLVATLNNFSSNPQLIFDQYLELGESLKAVSTKLTNFYQKMFQESTTVTEFSRIWAAYPSNLYKEADQPIRKELENIFWILANRDTKSQDLEILASKAPKLLRENPKSPALRVAHSICLRRVAQYEWSERELSMARTLDPDNPEITLNLCILLRIRSDEKGIPDSSKEEFLRRAFESSQTLVASDSVSPHARQLYAYFLWRTTLVANVDLTSNPTQQDVKNMEKAAECCGRALVEVRAVETDDIKNDPVYKQRLLSLVNDQAYYLGLTGARDNVRKAGELIATIQRDSHSRSSLDTLGFIALQRYLVEPSRDRIGLLQQAILTLLDVLRIDKSAQLSKDNLVRALDLFIKHGGSLTT